IELAMMRQHGLVIMEVIDLDSDTGRRSVFVFVDTIEHSTDEPESATLSGFIPNYPIVGQCFHFSRLCYTNGHSVAIGPCDWGSKLTKDEQKLAAAASTLILMK
ncbi:MAG: hypothetical protein WC400_02790, partial [Patescibacteria group bacterium]